ncbi:hypothetical protein NBEOAGPD_5142 [Methylobacterium gregans]|uniref:Uncharacterized protein n=1 Tax=Methylobacterium gregans TaxID=374424 RepID=A0AA37MIM5_9HYPH|nr:hypothetical protein NBEOAGPD_5142 [Methylobacterium gregans]
MAACGLEQDLGADHVGADEGTGSGDRAVDVALGGQVHHGLGAEVGEGGLDGVRVADVGLDEAVARVVGEGLQRDRVGRVGERVERGDLVPEILHQM